MSDSLKVKEIKEMAEVICTRCQADEYEIAQTEDGLLMKFPILGSDPEHYFDLLDITQENDMNIVNLDSLKKNILENKPGIRELMGA